MADVSSPRRYPLHCRMMCVAILLATVRLPSKVRTPPKSSSALNGFLLLVGNGSQTADTLSKTPQGAAPIPCQACLLTSIAFHSSNT